MSEKKFNVAMIGCGNIATSHLKGVAAKEECVLYAVCDNADDDRLERRKNDYGAKIAVKDYKELLGDPNIDFVIITVPDNSHMEIACAFMRDGKDVLLEKPMALTMEECEEMLKVEKETGKRLMVGQVVRYNNNFINAKKLVDEGAIGELAFVESEYAHDYSVARGYKDWRVSPEREGMIGGGCHAVDFLRWVAGDPTEVHAFSNHKYLLDWPVNDTTIAIYKFPNGVIGKVFCGIGVKRNYTMRTCLYGTKGTIVFDSKTPDLQLFQDNGEPKSYVTPTIVPSEPIGHNMTGEISDFVDAMIEGRPNPIAAIEGARTIAVCRATVESAKTGETVKIVYPEI